MFQDQNQELSRSDTQFILDQEAKATPSPWELEDEPHSTSERAHCSIVTKDFEGSSNGRALMDTLNRGYKESGLEYIGDEESMWQDRRGIADLGFVVIIRNTITRIIRMLHAAEDSRDSLAMCYLHLKKRVMDEYAIEITPEWEKRVLAGEHDVPLPRNLR